MAKAKATPRTIRTESSPSLCVGGECGLNPGSRGSHRFRVRIQGRGPRYELREADEEDYRPVEAAAWIQGFKDQLAISIAKIVLAREAAQAPQ